MEQERTNRNCPLWGTETCARLNMRACRGCPAEGKDPRECNDIRDDVNTLFSLLPEEGIASLFTDKTCSLCKGESKGSGRATASSIWATPIPGPAKRS